MLLQKSRNPARNVIAYTTHKAGSMVLHRVLKDICEINRIRYYSPNEARAALPFDRIFAGHDFIAKKARLLRPDSLFRSDARQSKRPASSCICGIRVMFCVSMFYSYCYMHAGEIERTPVIARRWRKRGLTASCSIWWARRFTTTVAITGLVRATRNTSATCSIATSVISTELLDRPNTIVVSYEEMVLAFPSWLEKS